MKFDVIKKEKLSEKVTNAIKNAILQGSIKPGDKLPTENELAEQFQVSRIVVLEALNRIEATGLLVTKHNSMFVTDTGQKALSHAFNNAILMQHIDVIEITEARLLFEPMVAGLAAEKRTEKHLEDLKKTITKAQKLMDKKLSAKSENLGFHSILAEATQNRVINLMMQTMLYSLERVPSPDVKNLDHYDEKDLDHYKDIVTSHKKIFDAVKNKDSSQATIQQRKHIISVQNLLKGRQK